MALVLALYLLLCVRVTADVCAGAAKGQIVFSADVGALMFHAQFAWQGTSCCAVERRGQSFTLVTCITSFTCDTSTIPHEGGENKQ